LLATYPIERIEGAVSLLRWYAKCSIKTLHHITKQAIETVVNHDFDATGLEQTSHRPWPIPPRPWIMTQTWHDLLFAHWPIDVVELRASIPPPFEVDLFEGTAWIGLVAFHMTNVAPRGVPSLPWLSRFAELNVRTYVRVDDQPGIFFFSLDAASAVAVRTARALFNLPYYTARMAVSNVRDRVEYRSVRESDGPDATFEAVYEAVGPSFFARPLTLEHFLTERYCLYHHHHSGAAYRLDIHHPPWSLRLARAQLRTNTMAAAGGLRLAGMPVLLHFAKRQDMVAWLPRALRGERLREGLARVREPPPGHRLQLDDPA
jgi:uncharacterized protein YqjF (DUF2071 family)